jgi:PHD/YefM family antitoxin component YafN of YafNO toxin-antitoxin module
VATETLIRVSSADFGKNVDQFIQTANSNHQAFEVEWPGELSVVVVSKEEFESWQETIHLLSAGSADSLLKSIAELDAQRE